VKELIFEWQAFFLEEKGLKVTPERVFSVNQSRCGELWSTAKYVRVAVIAAPPAFIEG
jgi:hypothetical protein